MTKYKCPMCKEVMNCETKEVVGICENEQCPVDTTKIRKRIIKPETFKNQKEEM
jgi:hypothetical protein